MSPFSFSSPPFFSRLRRLALWLAGSAACAGALAQAPQASPYGLQALWAGSDAVAKATLLILVLMSLGSWYMLLVKLVEHARLWRQTRRGAGIWRNPALAEAVDRLPAGDPLRSIAQAGLDALGQHASVARHLALKDWLALSIQDPIERVRNRLQGGLALLATVGSTAPFVGLFGTVWGIYHALTAIGVSGQASIDKVAGPVGEALIMTAIGLGVAVPAVLAYNWLVRRNKVAIDEVQAFGSALHTALLAMPAAAQK